MFALACQTVVCMSINNHVHCADVFCDFSQLNSVNRRRSWLQCQVDEITSPESLSSFQRRALPSGSKMGSCMKVNKNYVERVFSGIIHLVVDSKSAAMQITKDSISLFDVPKGTTISIMVPHSDTSGFQAMVSCCRRYSRKTLICFRKFMSTLIIPQCLSSPSRAPSV
jgi:hypothetical protein